MNDTLQLVISWLFGLPGTSDMQFQRVSFASWAQEAQGLFWLMAGVCLLVVIAVLVYVFFQTKGALPVRLFLACGRAFLLGLLFVLLAAPEMQFQVVSKHPSTLFLVFDGTDSMAIEDELPAARRSALAAATGVTGDKPRSRAAYIQALVEKKKNNLIEQLQAKEDLRIEAFVYDGQSTSQLRKLNAAPLDDAGKPASDKLQPAHIASQLSTSGQVTALGAALGDVGQKYSAGNLAGVVLFSDFAHNSGPAPLGSGEGDLRAPAMLIGAPVYTVGIGALEVIDLAVDVQTDPKMKRAEKTSVTVKLRQTGLRGQSAMVRCWAKSLSGGGRIEVGQKNVMLTGATNTVEFPFTPEEAGRFEFYAESAPMDGETVVQNNRASREVNIIDDYLRLMYVAHEPTWEWRFVKEVFHRDKLVGMQGFRTYLASSDPRVRESNVLFLPTLTPPRSQFFANDVIFLGDMQGKVLSPRFCERVKEFVGKFGGGLVVICGPRFGPQQLAGTPLESMLPVIPNPTARLNDTRSFRLKITGQAYAYPFMKMGENEAENSKAWNNLGELYWYQPVKALHPDQCTVLAQHPTDTCDDGKTPQPLIAVRKYGAGEVVYLGFNETWRLRRRYGDKYYRQFWSQLIYRLGMSHALGAEKRFEVRAERQQYRVEETATISIRAYDENFETLTSDKLAGNVLQGELVIPGEPPQTRAIEIPMLRQGEFEARVPVYTPGEYTMKVKDPVTGKTSEVRFEVSGLSAERRSGVRNLQMEKQLATATGGRAYDITEAHKLVDDIRIEPLVATSIRRRPLWNTPACFIVLIGLMLGEWLLRKMVRLR